MKKKTKTVLLSIVGAIMLISVTLGCLIKLMDIVFGTACGNQVLKTVPSPDGEKVAYVFLRDCGTTTNYSPQLSILDKGDHFKNDVGNTFISDKSFSIEWLDDRKLKVMYSQSSETSDMDKRVNGVKVEYYSD